MRIDHLKKVSLQLDFAGQAEGADDCQLIFIYGLSGRGLCPFEVGLHQKGVGDSLQIVVPRDGMHEFFGHLTPALCGKLRLPDAAADLQVKVTVRAIETPDDREIIQAMAQIVGHGCGGTCGCGCS